MLGCCLYHRQFQGSLYQIKITRVEMACLRERLHRGKRILGNVPEGMVIECGSNVEFVE